MAACEKNKACFTTSYLMTGWRRDRWNVGTSQFLFDSLSRSNQKGFIISRCLTRHFPGGSLQFLLLFCGRKCSKIVALQVFWCCVTLNTHQSVLQGMLHLFSAAFSFPISLAGWLLTTGLYPDNLWNDYFYMHSNAFKATAFILFFLLKIAFAGCFLY